MLFRSTHPSLRDIENQANYQALFRDEEAGIEMPFVGAIVGPYDLRNASHKSDVRWFHVVPGESGGGSTSEPNGRPFELRCDRDESAAMDSGGLIREVRGLADVFGDPKDDSRIDGSSRREVARRVRVPRRVPVSPTNAPTGSTCPSTGATA